MSESNTKIVAGLIVLLAIVVFVSTLLVVINYKVNFNIQNELYLNGFNVTLSKEAKNSLDGIYFDDLSVEIPSCLGGIVDENGVRVSEVQQAEIITTTEKNATYIRCPRYIGPVQTIGTIHNHPSGSCYLSNTDVQTYVNDLDRGQAIIGLKCSKGYVFYLLGYTETYSEEW